MFRNDEGRRPTESIQSCGVLGFELREFEGLQFTGSEVGSAVKARGRVLSDAWDPGLGVQALRSQTERARWGGGGIEELVTPSP